MNILQLLSEHWSLISAVLTVFIGFALWHLSQRFVSKKEFEAAIGSLNKLREDQEQVLHKLSASVIELNANINNMPNTGALHRLELGLEEVRGLQKETAAQLKGYGAAMDRLNNNFDRLAMKKESF